MERAISERALLNLRLLTRPNGAALAGLHPRWRSVWPRDASFVAVAFAATGHHEESYQVLSLPRSRPGTGRDMGGPLRRRRDPGARRAYPAARRHGLVPLGYLVLVRYRGGGERERAGALWPATRAAADAAAASLGADGLPPGGADYWEVETWRPNLGTAAPLRTGLRAAADLAAGSATSLMPGVTRRRPGVSTQG